MKSAILFLLAGSLGSCAHSAETENKNLKTEQQIVTLPQDKKAATNSTQNTVLVYDIPKLIGKNIDDVTRILGVPSEEDAPNLTQNELERRFLKKGYTLVVTYDTISRRISGFLIPATEHSGSTKNCAYLFRAGNLSHNDARYSVDSLAMAQPGRYGSIVVSPN